VTVRSRIGALLLAIAIATAGLLSLAAPASAVPTSVTDIEGIDPTADLVIFWGDGCPNCARQEVWLEQVEKQYPDLNVVRYEVWNSEANREFFAKVGEELGFEAGSVPTAIIGERVWIGWTDPIEQDLAGAIAMVGRGQLPQPGVFGTDGAGTCSTESLECSAAPAPIVIKVPGFGEVSLGDKSLLVSTIIIGFVDGINPCSLWVLSILLAIVLRTASRARVIAIGTTFLLITAAMYGLYMATFYSALTVVGYLGVIQWVVAGVAAVFGIVSVKDYFAFKKGISFTISDSAKPGIYQRMRAAAGHKALLPALGATVVLAVGVSLLETPCTAGFPVLWTGMLHANGVGPAETAALFVAYMIPFLLDELIVFAIAVITMRSMKLQEKHGELLKLFAGVTMLVLAAVMIIDPTLMEDPIAALALFAAAFVAAAIIHAVTTRIRAHRAATLGASSAEGT
jgi:thiol-disulfide isomerase/thioredoxin